MATEDKRALLGNLLKQKLQEDGEEKARSYVEMPDIPLPEEEVETGSSKAAIKERMKKLAAMGAVGMGTTALGAGLRDVGMAVSTAKAEFGDGRIDVRSIARKADTIAPRNVPREASRYLRASSGEMSPGSPMSHRKSATPVGMQNKPSRSSSVTAGFGTRPPGDFAGLNKPARSGSVTSLGSSSSFAGHSAISLIAKAAASDRHDSAESEPIRSDTQYTQNSWGSSMEPSSTPRTITVASSPPVSPTLKSSSSYASKVMVGLPHASSTLTVKSGVSASSGESSKAGSTSGFPKLSITPPPKSDFRTPVSPINSPSTTNALSPSSSKSATGGALKFFPESTKSEPVKSFVPVKSTQPVKPLGNSATKHAPWSPTKIDTSKPKTTTAIPKPEPEIVDTDPNRKYTLEELQKGTPEGVTAARKEDYLKLGAFKKAFGVDPETFAKYPEWKKVNLRKEAKIF